MTTQQTIVETLPAGVRVHRANYIHSTVHRAVADALGVLDHQARAKLEVFSVWVGAQLLGVIARADNDEWCWARGYHLTTGSGSYVIACAYGSAHVALYAASRA